jgi:signal transduction histidine kinase
MSIPVHVLIIEDSENDTLLSVQELKRAGYSPIHERVDTREAMIAAFPKKPWDIVIADYSMPKFSGLAAIKIIRDLGLDLPVIVVSGAIGEETAVAAMRAGAADYVMKGNLARLGPAIQRELRDVQERRDRRKAEAALRRTEVELDETQRSLVQSEKLAALGRFSSGVAHELKNPLGIVLGGIEFLEIKEKKAGPEVRTVVSKIKEAALRAAQIVDDILKFAKPSSLQLEATDPNELVKDTLTLFQYGIKSRDVEIGADYPRETMHVKVDKNRIQQVLFNLLANAIESLEHGGKVRVGVSKHPKSKAYPKGSCVIEVADTGVGIPPENIHHLFEPFFTTKRDQKGTGLGLSVAKTIVEHHNGDLKIESEAGKGTKVKVILQLAERG